MYYKVPKVGGATYSEKKYRGINLLGELTDRSLSLTNSNIRLAEKAEAPKDVTSVNVSNIPLWNRFTIALDNILSFNNSAEEISEYVNKGYGDAVNFVRNEEVSNNPDRSGIIAKLNQLEEDNNTSHNVKTQKLRDKQETLRNGSWFFDPDAIDPVFREKVNNNEFQWTEPRSYLYALPQIGSSMGEFATTIETATLGRLAGLTAKALQVIGGQEKPFGLPAAQCVQSGQAFRPALTVGRTRRKRRQRRPAALIKGIRQKVAAGQLGRKKPHQGAGGKQLIPVFYDPSHATALLEHIHAKPRLRGQPRARNVYPPSLETGDLGHHICIHKSTSSTIERHSQNHMESMKLSHPLSSLAPYAAGQEQERKEKTAAPLMHPSQRIAGE